MQAGTDSETGGATMRETRAPLRVAIAGCGSIGRRHLANLRQLTVDNPVEVCVYDVSASARQEAGLAFGATVARRIQDLWDTRPDIALICTPSHLHTPCAIAAASAGPGAALFIEKPVAHTLSGLDELQGLAHARNLTTLVGCNMRFHPGPAQIKRWLEEGVIGEVLSARLHTGSYLPSWRPHQDYALSYSASPQHGGAILDCIHELDLALWLLGPARLHSALVRPAMSLGLETDGMAELLLAHISGAISSVHLNFVQRDYERSIEVIGSNGTLRWYFTSGLAVHIGTDGQTIETCAQPEGWTVNRMYMDELAYFLHCVQNNAPTFNPVANAMQTLQIALQARRQSSDTVSFPSKISDLNPASDGEHGVKQRLQGAA